MQKSELEILKTSSLFRGMSDADINWLLSDERSVIRHFPKGAFIFKELDREGHTFRKAYPDHKDRTERGDVRGGIRVFGKSVLSDVC